VDAAGTLSITANGGALNLTPTPAPGVGETFEVAGIELTVNDAVYAAPPAATDSFTIGVSDTQSVFATIENLISGLDTIANGLPQRTGESGALIAAALTSLDNARDAMILQHAGLGGRLNAVESSTALLVDTPLYTKEKPSQPQSVDHAHASINLSFQTSVLQ